MTDKILAWYLQNKRPLPWREQINPYFIWLSEVILQQTRVDQGTSYYHKFVKAFPTVKHLAEADEAEVLKLWQGLGYYSRARNLHFAAKQVISTYNGQFPNNYKALLSLKGVGEYTAAAVASIAFNEVVPSIDGNVQRVISRLFRISDAVDAKDGKLKISQACNQLISKETPGDFNQAVMELGATICTPKQPKCELCPLQDHCLAYAHNDVGSYPVKKQKKKVKQLYLYYFELNDADGMLMQKRVAKGIWQNMFEHLLVESNVPLNDREIQQKFEEQYSVKIVDIGLLSEVEKHVLSHRVIRSQLFSVSVLPKHRELLTREVNIIKVSSLDKIPISRLTEILIEKRLK